MRLWHVDLISKLDAQHLLGQHRECCALRGNGWGKKHSVVDYVFKYDPMKLVTYHEAVIDEMTKRGYVCDEAWRDPKYRGKSCVAWTDEELGNDTARYPEHDEAYYKLCMEKLIERKGFKE